LEKVAKGLSSSDSWMVEFHYPDVDICALMLRYILSIEKIYKSFLFTSYLLDKKSIY
jgi:hypothetical protein